MFSNQPCTAPPNYSCHLQLEYVTPTDFMVAWTCRCSNSRAPTHSLTPAALDSSSRYFLPYFSTLRRVLAPTSVHQCTPTPQLLAPAPVTPSYDTCRHLDVSVLHQPCAKHSHTTAALASSSRYFLPYFSTLRCVKSPPAVRQRIHKSQPPSPAPLANFYRIPRPLDVSSLH